MPQLMMVEDIPVELRRNKRRRTRIAVNIDPAGHVVLDAPLHTQQHDVESLVREHARWLRFRVNQVREELAERGPIGYRDGEVVLFLGDALQLMTWPENSVVLAPGLLKVPTGDEASVKAAVRGWYLKRARQVFGEVIEAYAVQLPWLQGEVPKWRTSFMKSQWGSCSAKGVIALNTHLVRIAKPLIEYVVLHELCHLRHHDHSRRFHALMSMYMPDWSDRSKSLRQNIGLLLDS